MKKTIYYCDICQKQIAESELIPCGKEKHGVDIKIKQTMTNRTFRHILFIPLDLCNECAKFPEITEFNFFCKDYQRVDLRRKKMFEKVLNKCMKKLERRMK